MSRHVSHYLRPEFDPDNWVSLYYITQDAQGAFFFGFEDRPIPPVDLKLRIEEEEVVALTTSWPIDLHQSLWQTPCGDIWLASSINPVEDCTRIQLKAGVNPPFRSKYEIILRRPQDKRALSYIEDDFVTGSTYKHFARTVAEELAKRIGTTIKPSIGTLRKWEFLEKFLTSGVEDLSGLAYFLHPNRAELYSVIAFASLQSYTIYFNQKSRQLNAENFPLFDSTIPLSERIARAFQDNTNLKIGVLNETAATYELLNVARDSGFHYYAENALAMRGTVEDLKPWINEEPDNRVIICDHNFAKTLDEVTSPLPIDKSYKPPQYEHNTPRTKLFFPSPLPVGFVYNRRDQRWAELLREVTSIVVYDMFFNDDDALKRLREDLRVSLEAVLFSKEELYDSLKNIRKEINTHSA